MVEPKLLARFARRVRLARAWRGAAVGGCAGAAAAVVAASLDALGIAFAEPVTLAGYVMGGAALGALAGAALRVRLEHVAESVDRRGRLQNRVRTAMGSTEGRFAAQQAEDAQIRLADLRPQALFPLRFGRWHAGTLAAAVIAASVFLLGNTGILLDAQGKSDRSELKKLAPEVERIARPELKNPTPEEKALDAEMRQFVKELERGRLDRAEALAKANELSKKADELSRQRFQQAEKRLATAESALQKMLKDELAKNGFPGANPEELMRDPAEAAAEQKALNAQIQQLEKKLADEGLSEAERAQAEAALADAKAARQALELSEKARKTFEKLMNMPEWKELMEMAAKLKKDAQAGQAGSHELTPEEIQAMKDKLEELARQLGDEDAMRAYIEALKEALNEAGEG